MANIEFVDPNCWSLLAPSSPTFINSPIVSPISSAKDTFLLYESCASGAIIEIHTMGDASLLKNRDCLFAWMDADFVETLTSKTQATALED